MADQHIPRITNDPSAGPCDSEFAIAHKWFVDNYSPFEWNGDAVNPATFHSDTPGTHVEIVAPVGSDGYGPHVSNTVWTDINNTGALIIADDGTNVDGGNNHGIFFGTSVIGRKADESRCYVGIGIAL